MTSNLLKLAILLSMGSLCRSVAQAPLPATDLRPITNMIEKDFNSIDRIHTIRMTDDHLGRFDVIVVGTEPHHGWRVLVVSIDHHKVTTKWDSEVSAKELQYSNSGPQSVTINTRDYDYDLLIEGCAPHLCSDGVSGFLLFSGKSGKTAKAMVISQDLDKEGIQSLNIRSHSRRAWMMSLKVRSKLRYAKATP
jgi:hypothetical protein